MFIVLPDFGDEDAFSWLDFLCCCSAFFLLPSNEMLGSLPDLVLDSDKTSKNGGETFRSKLLSEGQSNSSELLHCNVPASSEVPNESKRPAEEDEKNVKFFDWNIEMMITPIFREIRTTSRQCCQLLLAF